MPLGAFRLNSLSRHMAQVASGRTANTVTAYGDAQIDTAQFKFSGSSAVFDGTDKLYSDSSIFNYGGNNFTAECWIYPTTISGAHLFLGNRSGTSIDNYVWQYRIDSNGTLNLTTRNPVDGQVSTVNGTTVLSTGNWYHIALVRNGTGTNSCKTYINGVEEEELTRTISDSLGSNNLYIGARGDNAVGFIGNLDEVRISNTARYTSNFTPSTVPFINDDNTLLLLHMNGTDGSTTFVDDNGSEAAVLDGILVNASTRIQTLSITNAMSSTSREGTYSFWYKDNDYASRTATQNIWRGYTSTNAYLAGVSVWVSTAGIITFYGYFGANNGWVAQQANTAASALNDGNWHHIAYSYDRSGIAGQLYIDGVSVTISSTRYNNATDGNDLIGRRFIGATSTTTTNPDPFSIAQMWYDDTRIDLSTNIDKFYDSTNGAPVNLGADGTATGLSQPAVYHYGNTNTFYPNSGRSSGSTYMTYTLSVSAGSASNTATNI